MTDFVSFPELSIIVPVYNAEKQLQRCLDSISSQSYQNFECILVNDGSTDQSGQICDAYMEKDPRFRVCHKQNGGVSSARNAGIKASRGQFLAFVDSDDALLPDYLAHLVSDARKYNADLVVAGHTLILNDVHTRISAVTGTCVCSPANEVDECFSRALATGILNTCWGKLFRRDAIQGCCFDETISWGEDTVFVLNCLRAGTVVRFSTWNEYLYYYTPGGLEGTFNIKKTTFLIRYYRELFEFSQRMFSNSECWQRAVDIKVSQEILRIIFALSGQKVTLRQKKQYLDVLFSDKAVNRRFTRGVALDDNPGFLKLLARFHTASVWMAFLAVRDMK